jgi:hypothetical protein
LISRRSRLLHRAARQQRNDDSDLYQPTKHKQAVHRAR